MLELIERAGRTCYKSEERITDDSAPRFCQQILGRGHESVIEHVVLTVRFTANRGFTHELVRHRLASYSQESTRYCNYQGGVAFVIPPWVDLAAGDYESVPMVEHPPSERAIWFNAVQYAEASYLRLLSDGWQPQQARGVLPIDLKTEIVITANVRVWRHIFRMRCSSKAHPQMRELMIPLRDTLRSEVPVLFDDKGDD
jgi:thymidylate synthase (FAD)